MKNTQKKQKELLTLKISRKQKKSENKTKCVPLKNANNKKVRAILKNNSQVFADTGLQGKNVKVLKRDNANKLFMLSRIWYMRNFIIAFIYASKTLAQRVQL